MAPKTFWVQDCFKNFYFRARAVRMKKLEQAQTVTYIFHKKLMILFVFKNSVFYLKLSTA
jgi:hypothetical protein